MGQGSIFEINPEKRKNGFSHYLLTSQTGFVSHTLQRNSISARTLSKPSAGLYGREYAYKFSMIYFNCLRYKWYWKIFHTFDASLLSFFFHTICMENESSLRKTVYSSSSACFVNKMSTYFLTLIGLLLVWQITDVRRQLQAITASSLLLQRFLHNRYVGPLSYSCLSIALTQI